MSGKRQARRPASAPDRRQQTPGRASGAGPRPPSARGVRAAAVGGAAASTGPLESVAPGGGAGGGTGRPSPLGRWLSSDRARLAALMTLFALIAIAALTYLAIVKLTNTQAVCFVVQGCDQVEASRYSLFLGIPVALYGLAMVLVVLGSVLAWWRTGDRRLLYVPYTLGLIGVFVIAALVYLELFVIHAVCIWCTTAGTSIILGWIVSIVAVRRSSATA